MRGKMILAALLAAAAVPAQAVVVNFDDLPGTGSLPASYGGINWSNFSWVYYDAEQPPYYPSSPATRVFATLGTEASFEFDAPVTFDGAFFTGFETLSYDLYLDDVLVATSGVLALSDMPTFLASGYAGLIDKVTVNNPVGNFWVMDDVTYNGGSVVPEPASWAMMIGGFGLVGGALRSRRRSATKVSVTYA